MIKHLSEAPPPSKASKARESKKFVKDPKEIWELLKPQLDNLVQEIVWGLYIDSSGKVLGVQEISRGAVDHVETLPRELFRPAFELAAVGVIMVHNHPSGVAKFSEDDKRLAQRMIGVGALLEMPLYDSIVITKDGYRALNADEHMHEFQCMDCQDVMAERLLGLPGTMPNDAMNIFSQFAASLPPHKAKAKKEEGEEAPF